MNASPCPTLAAMLEMWRPVGRDTRYEVSWDGRVRNAATGRVLRPQGTGKGYRKVHLGRAVQVQVHQLVTEAWHGARPVAVAATVDHIDFERTRNCATNLRWLPYGENSRRHYAAVAAEPEPDGHVPMDDAELEAYYAAHAAAGW